ncbi:ribosome silencing factor [Leucobacter triazinivorans]|uniref:Ribosomal silencing factor RsfS n=1 Tax=Leucobacter triazinivorans TaxID=1784719 RepID=A0A4P6KK12_9MICO|nr:ribosome silencing factor [Leucobacter triazinivorans]QBE49974.1 ribosome silencing factor [Leucobacter triazinivorans]
MNGRTELEHEVTQNRDVLADLGIAVRAAEEKGATAPVALQVSAQFGLADVFLIVSGSVERNVQAISDGIEDALNAEGVRTVRREGRESGRWVLLDFGDLIVHVFHHEERDFYQLEKLWQDCPLIDVAPLLAADGEAPAASALG